VKILAKSSCAEQLEFISFVFLLRMCWRLLRLRLFRRKIFSTVKCLQIQMISGKIIFFPVFDCILENSLKNIFQCLGQRKMKKKKNQKPQQMQTHHRKPP
jgi:hypothetical protein